jgi:hypothetical protein
MEEKKNRVSAIFAANRDPLLDPTNLHVFAFVDAIRRGDGVILCVAPADELQHGVELLELGDVRNGPSSRVLRAGRSAGQRAREQQRDRRDALHICATMTLGILVPPVATRIANRDPAAYSTAEDQGAAERLRCRQRAMRATSAGAASRGMRSGARSRRRRFPIQAPPSR